MHKRYDKASFVGSGDCPVRPTWVTRPKRWNEAIRVADLGAQSPSLAITLWRTVRPNDAKATAFSGRCERVAPFEPLTLITPDASRDSRRYRRTKHTAAEERSLILMLMRGHGTAEQPNIWSTPDENH